MKTWQTLTVGILIGILIGGGILLVATSNRTAGATIQYISPTQDANITVSVVGLVKQPGVYRLPTGSRINDAISAAGGTLENADLSSINLADWLEDGEQINIEDSQNKPTASTSETQGKININQASLAELDSLPGVGAEKAKAIIDYRNQHGNFVTIKDILYVPGFGTSIFNEIKDLIDIK